MKEAKPENVEIKQFNEEVKVEEPKKVKSVAPHIHTFVEQPNEIESKKIVDVNDTILKEKIKKSLARDKALSENITKETSSFFNKMWPNKKQTQKNNEQEEMIKNIFEVKTPDNKLSKHEFEGSHYPRNKVSDVMLPVAVESKPKISKAASTSTLEIVSKPKTVEYQDHLNNESVDTEYSVVESIEHDQDANTAKNLAYEPIVKKTPKPRAKSKPKILDEKTIILVKKFAVTGDQPKNKNSKKNDVINESITTTTIPKTKASLSKTDLDDKEIQLILDQDFKDGAERVFRKVKIETTTTTIKSSNSSNVSTTKNSTKAKQ
jgi:hypothetical protein